MDTNNMRNKDDERLRKTAIAFLKDFAEQGYENAVECVDWLEKQGEQEEPQVYETEDGKIITYSETDGYKFVEPNFHEGDWVVNKFGDSWHIDSLDKKNYQVSDGKGNYNYFPISKQDEMHLWNIQDAKDGDVLVHSSFMFDDFIFIYNNTSILQAYCYYSNERNRFIIEDRGHHCPWNMQEVKPATKEQCDLLFQKIKEADYKWNAETKTLEKLVKPKFKVGDRIRHKETNKDDVYIISKVYDDSYGIAVYTWMINMKYQDQYELVPNKLDPKTLQPFDKVLVRDCESDMWKVDFYSHKDADGEFPYVCIGSPYTYCIPYNDDTACLVGTKDDPSEFYRYWED